MYKLLVSLLALSMMAGAQVGGSPGVTGAAAGTAGAPSISGTPTVGQIALWVNSTQLQGVATLPSLSLAGIGAGNVNLIQGASQTAPVNGFGFQAPTVITTGFLWTVPNADCSGLVSIASDVMGCASAENPQTSTYQVLASDFSGYKTILVASGTFTITLVANTSQPAAGQYINVINYGSGVVTIARSGQNINGGVTSISLLASGATIPTAAHIESDGTNYFASMAGANATTLLGKTWGVPNPIGGTTPSTGSFTTLQTTSATLALSTTAVGAHTCAAAQTASLTGAATTSVIKWSFASTPIGIVGYGDATTPFLTITTFATTNTANVVVCNTSAASITPGTMSLNLRLEL